MSFCRSYGTRFQVGGLTQDLRPGLSCVAPTGLGFAGPICLGPMESKWATRRHAAAAALAPRLQGLNIAPDLMQVGKVVTGQQSLHHGQGLRATLIVAPAALQVLR